MSIIVPLNIYVLARPKYPEAKPTPDMIKHIMSLPAVQVTIYSV